MKKKVLIVDDEEFFLDVIAGILDLHDISTATANSVQKAQEILTLQQDFQLILSDFKMPGANGLDLFNWTKRHGYNVPFIMMTGFSDIKSTSHAHELGLQGFLSKPFSDDDLMEAINEVLASNDDEVSQRLQDYSEIPIGLFFSEYEIPYKVYIKLHNDRLTKIAHSGETLGESRLDNYKKQGVKSLYIKKEDFKQFISFNLSISKGQPDYNVELKEKKSFLVSLIGEQLFKFIFFEGMDKELFHLAADTLTQSISTFIDKDDHFKLVESLCNSSITLYIHSLSVSVFSVLIAKQLGIKENKDLFKISLAAFLHDIGKSELPVEILNTPIDKWENRQKEALENHCTTGMEILSRLNTVQEDVLNIILHHHDIQGTQEYDKKEPWVKWAHIVCVANIFSNIVSRQKIQPSKVIESIDHLTDKFPDLRPDVIEALHSLFEK